MKLSFSAALYLLTTGLAVAQVTATVRGRVSDQRNQPVTGAEVVLRNPITGFEARTATDDDGRYQLSNIPWQTYELSISKAAFQSAFQHAVVLRSNIASVLDFQLELADVRTRVEVSGSASGLLVDAESTGTRTELNRSSIDRMPVVPGTRGLESVLLSMPGFAANANGAIHPRGAHNQMTYVIDGVPISDQLTGAFGNSVDSSVVQSIELFTGNIPAEFGNKVSGVAVVTTRTGLGTGEKFSGSTQVIAGGFDTLGSITQFSGGNERWGYFASFNALKSNRYLDQVSLQNVHNGGNSERSFVRLDWQPTGRDQLRLNLMAGRSSFQLANLPSQQAAGQDQRQEMQDGSVSVGWLRTLDATSTVDTTVGIRSARARLIPSLFDTPVTAEQDRRLTTVTVSSRWNRVRGRQIFRAGGDMQRFPVSEYFRVANTYPVRQAETIFRGKDTGGLYSGFVQDSIRLGNLQLTLGLRYDNYRFLVVGDQWQPRVGLAWRIAATNTVLRASYNRTYQTPPNENLLFSNSGGPKISPERQNVFEVGLQQGIGTHISINSSYFHKNSRDLQDNDNFLNTGIIFPISLAQSRTNGLEARIALLPVRGISGTLSFTHMHTIVTPPFTGGLFQGSDPVQTYGSAPFVIDHDQPLGIHGVVYYQVSRRFWASTSVRYDSGLVTNPSDPEQVAADPDYRDLLPYVNLGGAPPRVRPRTLTDVAIGYEKFRGDRKRWDAVVQVSNIANVTALYNFQSAFVGTRLVQPRTASVKLRVWF